MADGNAQSGTGAADYSSKSCSAAVDHMIACDAVRPLEGWLHRGHPPAIPGRSGSQPVCDPEPRGGALPRRWVLRCPDACRSVATTVVLFLVQVAINNV